MTKQKEIRDKVIDFILFAERQGAGTIERTKSLAEQADELLSYLDSVGGCLKVKRELLANPYSTCDPHEDSNEEELAYLQAQNDMAGWEAVEALIDKEVKHEDTT